MCSNRDQLEIMPIFDGHILIRGQLLNLRRSCPLIVSYVCTVLSISVSVVSAGDN